MKKIKDFIINHSLMVVIISLVLLIPAAIGYYKTKINYNILVYLPEDIDTIKGQDILTDDFGIGAFSFVMVDNMSNYDILKLEDKIKKIDSVNAVISLADITDTTIPISMLPDDVTDRLYKDGETVLVVTFATSTSDEKTMDAVTELRSTVKDASKVSGMTAMVLDTRELSEQEIVAYIIVAVVLCLIVLTLCTDSYLIPVLLLGNIGFAIIYNMGTNIIFGNISYITKAISAVLQLGVTTDFSIFLYHKYENAKLNYKDKKQAMSKAVTETFQSVIGSSLTTIAGFLALCAMNLTLGKDIGLVMAKGVFWGLVCVLTLFPALLLTFDNLIEKTKHKVVMPKFEKLQNFSIKHYRLLFIIFILLLIPAWYGNNNVEVYYKLDKSLPETLASSVANSDLKEKYNIVSPEIILLDKNIKSEEITSLADELKEVKGIDLVLAPTSLLDFGLPESMLPDDIVKVISNDKYQLVIVNSTYEVASDELNNQISTVNKIVKKYDKKAIIAGEGPLMKDLTEISDTDFHNVNYLSIIIIFILMLLVLKSASLPVILVCAIEFAIFVNMGISYYTHDTLPFIASIVIGTIQLGATIDYAILMSTKYIEERNNNDKMTAIKNTLSNTVPSIITSALCFFAATIGVFLYSKIDMIGAICKLLSRGSIISMLVVVLILPSLLIIFDKIIVHTTKGLREVK
jgi:uncharacterized protein